MVRRLVFAAATVVAVVLSLMPLVTGERDIGVQPHHLDHAVLMFFGLIAGLALDRRRTDAESPRWIWPAVLSPLVAMILMAPSLYAAVDQIPWLHALDHLVFVGLAMLTAYSGQRYVRGVGWGMAFLLETMAVVAAFGYGVAPASPTVAASSPGVATSFSLPGDVARGRAIFAANCAVCHGAHGQGNIGPSLQNEASRKNFAQVQAWIENPAPPMPRLYPSPLNARNVRDVAAFVESLR